MAEEHTRRKTRALRKYEAAEVEHSVDPGTPPLRFFSPFGPLIGRSEAPAALVQTINRYVDAQLREGEAAELLLPEQLVREGGEASLVRRTEELIARYVREMEGAEVRKIQIDVFWIVSQYSGTPSPVHFHTGDISGILYLRTPSLENEAGEEQKTYISGRQAGYINFLIGGKQRFFKSLISFKPQVGDFYVFPGWLLHGAEPFRGTGERRSLAFNAFVEI